MDQVGLKMDQKKIEKGLKIVFYTKITCFFLRNWRVPLSSSLRKTFSAEMISLNGKNPKIVFERHRHSLPRHDCYSICFIFPFLFDHFLFPLFEQLFPLSIVQDCAHCHHFWRSLLMAEVGTICHNLKFTHKVQIPYP